MDELTALWFSHLFLLACDQKPENQITLEKYVLELFYLPWQLIYKRLWLIQAGAIR